MTIKSLYKAQKNILIIRTITMTSSLSQSSNEDNGRECQPRWSQGCESSHDPKYHNRHHHRQWHNARDYNSDPSEPLDMTDDWSQWSQITVLMSTKSMEMWVFWLYLAENWTKSHNCCCKMKLFEILNKMEQRKYYVILVFRVQGWLSKWAQILTWSNDFFLDRKSVV